MVRIPNLVAEAAGCIAVVTRERRLAASMRFGWVPVGLAALWMFQPGLARAQLCVGDCNDDGAVTVNELVKGVNISSRAST